MVMMWGREMEVDVVNFFTHYIHAKINHAMKKLQWWLIGFYGTLRHVRGEVLEFFLSELNLGPYHAWGVPRDFNKILSQDKEKGGYTKGL